MSLRLLATGAVAILGSLQVFAQGVVNLNNYDSNMGIFKVTSGVTNAAPIGTFVEVLGGANAGTMTAMTSTGGAPTNRFTVIDQSNPNAANGGFFDGGSGVASGVPGGTSGSFQVRAWQGATTFALAQSTIGAFWGTSTIFTQNAGTYTPPSPPPNVPLNIPARIYMTATVPEPSTIILSLLGVGALLLRRKRSA